MLVWHLRLSHKTSSKDDTSVAGQEGRLQLSNTVYDHND